MYFNTTKAKYLPANIDSDSGNDIDGSSVCTQEEQWHCIGSTSLSAAVCRELM